MNHAEPFIRMREVLTSTPWGGWVKDRMPEELRRRFFSAYWSEAKSRRHLEMLKAFGFNSIQTGGNPCNAWWVGADEGANRRKQIARCRFARKLGMSISVSVWGAAVADRLQQGSGPSAGQQFTELDWHKPEDRARLEAWYEDQAEFAPFADRVITHWVDPGYIQDGGIDTVVEMHNHIVSVNRRRNPSIHGALSTWFMPGQMGRRYPGFDGPGSVAAHPDLDKDTEVLIGLMNYHSDGVNLDGDGQLKAPELDSIKVAGRQAGVWGWYTADNEINPSMHVRIDVMQDYFRSLPPQTQTDVTWHSIDDNFSGLNTHNLYVAAKLMLDPSLDAATLLDEFVAGFVGECNAAPVTAALRAIEQARTRSVLYRARAEDAVAPPPAILKDHKPLGASWLDETCEAVLSAIAGMKRVTLAPNHRTPWPVSIEPAEYLEELNAHLEAVRQMLAFLHGARVVEKLYAAGSSAKSLEAAIGALPRVEYDQAHTAGMEAAIYEQKLSDLKQVVGSR